MVELVALADLAVPRVLRAYQVLVALQAQEVLLQFLRHMLADSLEAIRERFVFHTLQML